MFPWFPGYAKIVDGPETPWKHNDHWPPGSSPLLATLLVWTGFHRPLCEVKQTDIFPPAFQITACLFGVQAASEVIKTLTGSHADVISKPPVKKRLPKSLIMNQCREHSQGLGHPGVEMEQYGLMQRKLAWDTHCLSNSLINLLCNLGQIS